MVCKCGSNSGDRALSHLHFEWTFALAIWSRNQKIFTISFWQVDQSMLRLSKSGNRKVKDSYMNKNRVLRSTQKLKSQIYHCNFCITLEMLIWWTVIKLPWGKEVFSEILLFYLIIRTNKLQYVYLYCLYMEDLQEIIRCFGCVTQFRHILYDAIWDFFRSSENTSSCLPC